MMARSRFLKATPESISWEAVAFVGGCQVAGFASSFLGGAFKKQPWSDDTRKPRIWPPQWVFPVVWVGNYTCMGLAAWRVWQRRNERPVGGALALFGLHLLHNLAFIPLVNRVKKRGFYVGMDATGLASALVAAGSFRPVSRSATQWMIPYIGWLFFTTLIKILWWRMETKET